MARKLHTAGADALEEIQSASDRLGAWLERHLLAVVLGVGLALAAAALFQYASGARERREAEASAAWAAATAAYLAAMGAPAGALEVPELANPAAAERIRSEYIERFRAVAEAHAGTVSGTLARLEQGNLLDAAGDRAAAIAAWELMLAESPRRDALRGLALQRLGSALEDAGRWAEAAARHEQAAQLGDYPLRHWALADAARCLAQAGERERALALYERLEREAPQLRLPEHHKAAVATLRAGLDG